MSKVTFGTFGTFGSFDTFDTFGTSPTSRKLSLILYLQNCSPVEVLLIGKNYPSRMNVNLDYFDTSTDHNQPEMRKLGLKYWLPRVLKRLLKL